MCLASRAAKGLPLPKPVGKADSAPASPMNDEAIGDVLCADAELAFSSRSLVYATRQPQNVDRKRLMAERASQSTVQIPVHLQIKLGGDEVLLGTVDLQPGLTIGDVRMQARPPSRTAAVE